MKLGYIGLGKMGLAMVTRILEHGHEVVVYNRSKGPVEEAVKKGAQSEASIGALVETLTPPRSLWLMVPASAVDEVLDELKAHLKEGDTVIDGGNSNYKESMRRAETLLSHGIHFLDAGVSGGPGGARDGACVMVGGPYDVYDAHKHLFKDVSAPDAFNHFGKSGAGHFVKMVHNGIEYGMMQSLAEGFAIMKTSAFDLNLHQVADVYNHRSVIESRLVGWLKQAYEEYGEDLTDISGEVGHTGEGLWTVEAARELRINAPIIEGSLRFRQSSKGNPSYIGQILSALRNQFGGHKVQK